MKSIGINKLNRFESTKQHLNNNNAKFAVVSVGMTKKIKYTNSDYGMRFCDSYIKGGFICTMVQKDIDAYIEKNGPLKLGYGDKNYVVTQFNPTLIESNLHLPMKAIDCNYFYFQIAYNLGFITKETFEKGISKRDEYKQARLAAIGGLNKLPHIDYYANGEKVGEANDWETHMRYSPFYWKVIKVACDLMDDVFRAFPSDVCMWLTDCCYTTVGSEKKIVKYITDRGYGVKTFGIDFEFIEWDKVGWYDCKEQCSKTIRYTKYQTFGLST